jgi:hypothetical protein
MAACGFDRTYDVTSSRSSLVVATMKGLVGDARSDPDLTPTEPSNPGGFNRSVELVVGVPHHCGRFGDGLQQILGRQFSILCLDTRLSRRRRESRRLRCLS